MQKEKSIILILLISLQFLGYAQSIERNDLSSNNIELTGWAKEFMNRQETGLTGHPEESGFPFNTGMWTKHMDYTDREFPGGSGWWPYEQTGYYLDGALRCGYLNNSDELIIRVKENINHVINNADEEGTLHAGSVADDWSGLVETSKISSHAASSKLYGSKVRKFIATGRGRRKTNSTSRSKSSNCSRAAIARSLSGVMCSCSSLSTFT